MKILERFMPLENGEDIVSHLEGNAYTNSSNPIIRLIYFIIRIFSIILGCPSKAHVIVTNRRLIVIQTTKFLWFFHGSADAKSVMPRSIGSMGYHFARSFLVFRSHYLSYSFDGSEVLVKSQEGRDKVYEMIACGVRLAEKVSVK